MSIQDHIERTKRGFDRTVSDADRAVSRLSSSESDPVGRDAKFDTGLLGRFTGEFERSKPDAGEIEDYIEDYRECPIVSTPIDNYASDVVSPGIRIETTNSDLEEDLIDFASTAAIRAGEFDHDFADLLEEQVRDAILRGTGIAEIAYADRSQAEEIKGVRLLRAETITPYTRPGQAILLRPDDNPTVRSERGDEREAPTTAADKTACYVQFDDVFASYRDRDEIAFAQDDVVKVVNNPETGAIFGRSDVESIHSRVRGLLQKLEDVDTAIAAKAYAFWLIKIGTDESSSEEDIAQAKKFMKEQEPENYGPGKKQAVPHTVGLETFSGEVPEVWESMEFDVEFILLNLKTPKYRSGFADNVNRDLAIRQQEDYMGEVRAMRRKLEAAWKPVFKRVAEQKGHDDPQFEILIEEQRDANPLRAQWFDAEEFRALMLGIKEAAPGGQTERILPPEYVLDWLGQDPKEILGAAQGINPEAGNEPPSESEDGDEAPEPAAVDGPNAPATAESPPGAMASMVDRMDVDGEDEEALRDGLSRMRQFSESDD